MEANRIDRGGSAGLSRRAALSLAPVAAGAFPGMRILVSEPNPFDPDAYLMDLGRQWAASAQEQDAQDAEHTAAEERFLELRPKWPPRELIKTERDAELQLCARCNVGQVFQDEFIEQFRQAPRVQSISRPITHVERANGFPADAHTIVERQPWPEAQARADEIVAARDRYRAEVGSASAASGLDMAEARHQTLAERNRELRRKIVFTPATTVKGLLLKAIVVEWCFGGLAEWDEILLTEARQSGPTGEVVGMSLVRDLMRLSAGLSSGPADDWKGERDGRKSEDVA